MMFKPGDIVKCVNAGTYRGLNTNYLQPNRLYTVDKLGYNGSIYVIGINQGFFAERFELYSKEDNVTRLLNKVDEI